MDARSFPWMRVAPPEIVTFRSILAFGSISILTAIVVIAVFNVIHWLLNLRFVKMSQSESDVAFVAYRVTRKGDGILLCKAKGESIYTEIMDPKAKHKLTLQSLRALSPVRIKFHFSYHWTIISHLNIVLDDVHIQ